MPSARTISMAEPDLSLPRRLSDLAQRWTRALQEQRPAAVGLRHELHAEPRVSGDERETRDRVIAASGLVFVPVADTGGITRIGPGKGPSIAIRGELDALPIAERTDVAWASRNGTMHACGHDVHLAALTALLRAADGLDLPYALVGILQPREETYPSGALDIQRSGMLDDFEVAHVIGAHVHPRIPTGEVATGSGVVNAAAGELEITVQGQSGHGAYPHHGNDVIAPLASIALGLPEVLRRTVDPLAPALVSIGRLIADAGAANVLPGKGTLLATLRTTGSGDADRVAEAIRRFASGQAESYGVTATTLHIKGEPVLDNNAELSRSVDRWLPEFGLKATSPMRSLGADDFSYFSEQVPSLMCFVGVGTDASTPSLHDPTFLPDDDAVMRVAASMLAGYLAAAEVLARGNTSGG